MRAVSEVEPLHRPAGPLGARLALALGGGAARGLAHIGVLEVLEREGIRSDCVVGSSMGGLIGALTAAGLRARDIAEVARGFRFPRWFLPGGIVGWDCRDRFEQDPDLYLANAALAFGSARHAGRRTAPTGDANERARVEASKSTDNRKEERHEEASSDASACNELDDGGRPGSRRRSRHRVS